MAEKPAVNASPLIFLVCGDLLNLLKSAGDKVVDPAAVAEEIQQRGPDDPTVQTIEKHPGWPSFPHHPFTHVSKRGIQVRASPLC